MFLEVVKINLESCRFDNSEMTIFLLFLMALMGFVFFSFYLFAATIVEITAAQMAILYELHSSILS